MQRYIGKLIVFGVVLAALAVFIAPSDSLARRTRKITIQDEAIIKGKIVRPELSLIIQRSKINYDALKLNESFLPRIIRSVKQSPF
jgi:hypothetical protein